MKKHVDEERTIGDLVQRKAKKNKDRTCLLWKDQKITYEELDLHSNRMANGLKKFGVQKGDKVCIFMDNSPEYMYLWIALAKIGAIEVPINTSNKGELLSHVINNSDAKSIIVDSKYQVRLQEIFARMPNIDLVFVKGEFSGDWAERKGLSVYSFDSMNSGIEDPPDVEVRPSDIWSIMYTSGTTGAAKGVVLTHNYAFEFTSTLIRYLRTTRDDVQYNCWI